MSFDQRLARINLTKVMQRVEDEYGVTGNDLVRAEDMYRKFLTLMAYYPEHDLTPSRLIDLVWHTHITETRQYMTDCDLLFGHYLHHGGIGDQPERLEKSRAFTQESFEAVFHMPMTKGLIPEYACMAGCVG